MDAEPPAGLSYQGRRPLLEKLQSLRAGRVLVCLFNFDRESGPAPGLTQMLFDLDVKEALFRVLKESHASGKGIDLCLYTRGGNTNAVWPIVSVIREFDPDFEVLVPFRCHSAGTLLCLGARRIVLGPMSELSPIHPSTGNQFNPVNSGGQHLAISVEDVRAYRSFIRLQLKGDSGASISPFLDRLVSQVHPLALGNVHRAHRQIRNLARQLLKLHDLGALDPIVAVNALTSRFQTHVHMINRQEAKQVLGDRVTFASPEVAQTLDELLRAYEDRFDLRRPFLMNAKLQDKPFEAARLIKGVLESPTLSYFYELKTVLRQYVKLPPGVTVQLPPGQPIPLVPGLPREYDVEVTGQAWVRNKAPRGITT